MADWRQHNEEGARIATELDSMLEQLRCAARQPFESATPIPSVLNHSSVFFEEERKQLFTQEWICVGRDDEIDEAGKYLTMQILDVPILIVRQKDGLIKGFVNVCAHRQAHLVAEASGSTTRFTCPYHAWTYDLDGHLVRAPYMEMKPEFDKTQHGLKTIHIDIWAGFVYVSLSNEKPVPVSQRLSRLNENVVGRFDMASYRTILREQLVWNANWKNLIENFTESYHVPIAHKKTFAQHGKSLENYLCGEDNEYYAYHRAAQESDVGAGAAHQDNQRLEGEWRRMMIDFCVFPCHLVTLMPDYLWYVSVLPEGTGQLRATWGVAVAPENLKDVSNDQYESWVADYKNYIDIANEEDRVLVEALHLGTRSSLLPKGTYHPLERNLWQFVNYLSNQIATPKSS